MPSRRWFCTPVPGVAAGQRRRGERRRQLAGRALPSGAALMRGVPGCAQWEPALPAGWGCSEARVIDGLVFLLQSPSRAVRIYGRGPQRAGGGRRRLPGLQAEVSGGLRLLLPSRLMGQVLEERRASVSPSLLPLGRGVGISG